MDGFLYPYTLPLLASSCIVRFAGLDAGMQAVQLAGFDPEGFHELMDAMRSDEISLPFCSSVCQLTCLCKLGGR